MGIYRDIEKRRAYFRGNKKHIALVTKRKVRVQKENQEKLWSYLSDKHCVDCPETDSMVLEFDHVRGDKRKDIGRMLVSCSWTTILIEIAKCEIRCANCHQRRTREIQKDWRWSKRQESNLNLDTNLV